MSTRTIHVTAGQERYVGGTIRETSGKNISADAVVMALGAYATPPNKTAGGPPDSDTQGATTAERVVKLLVTVATTPASDQWVWAWITDAPEVEPVRLDGPFDIV